MCTYTIIVKLLPYIKFTDDTIGNGRKLILRVLRELDIYLQAKRMLLALRICWSTDFFKDMEEEDVFRKGKGMNRNKMEMNMVKVLVMYTHVCAKMLQ